MYDIHRLRLLGELKRRGTLAAVADALGYSPSTVSHQLATLEAEVGVPLLEPDGRRVRLTGQGEILVAHVEGILDAMDRARSDLAASLEEVAGTVRLAAFQTAALAIVPPALAALAASHPRLRVHLRHMETEESLPALVGRELDLVIAEEYPGFPLPPAPELSFTALGSDRLLLALPAGAEVDEADEVDGGDPLPALADRPWAMEPERAASRQWATTRCRRAGFEPDVRFEASDILVQAELARRGQAAAILPELVLGFERPGLRTLSLGPEAVRQIVLVTRRGSAADPALEACRRALARALTPRD